MVKRVESESGRLLLDQLNKSQHSRRRLTKTKRTVSSPLATHFPPVFIFLPYCLTYARHKSKHSHCAPGRNEHRPVFAQLETTCISFERRR